MSNPVKMKDIARDMNYLYDALVEEGMFHAAALELTVSYFKGGYSK